MCVWVELSPHNELRTLGFGAWQMTLGILQSFNPEDRHEVDIVLLIMLAEIDLVNN